jgi:hypothetical protein
MIDVIGLRFNRLIVVKKSARMSKAGALWECACDCGGRTITTSLKLRRGHIKSCGCFRKEILKLGNPRTHGRSATRDRTYKTWKEMRNRCNNPSADNWKWYGGKDISICPGWNSFECFLSDMGERPDGHTLDRIDSDGDYCNENCRWATPKQQAESNRGCFRPGSNKH